MAHLQSICESQYQFAWDLYSKLAADPKKNIFFSPFSIATAIAMVHMGAKGKTEEEIQSVMHLHSDKDVVKNGFKTLIAEYQKEAEEYTLKTSNLAYISHHLDMLKDFENDITVTFKSKAKCVDFSKSEDVRHEINKAVEDHTNGKIVDLIGQGVLDSLTRMVLVNAVYFKGLWANQFNPKHTTDEKFWISNDEFVTVPMMYKSGSKFKMGQSKEMDCKALCMDYKGGRISMIILLPNKKDGLSKLESNISKSNLESLEKNMREMEVDVSLPKFKLEESLDLIPLLSEMGIMDLFNSSAADLSGISGSKDLFVSAAVHKAFVEVNEEGAEAAAATAFVMVAMCARITPSFIADRSFTFYIKDNETGVLLFLGRLCRPNSA